MSPLVLIAHAADTHLGRWSTKPEREERDRDIEDAFKQMIDLIMMEHVKILIIAGDLFDRPRPSNSTLLFFRDSVREFLERGGKIILVNGEHDTPGVAEVPSTFLVSKYLNNVYHLKHFFLKDGPLSMEEDGKRLNFYGMGVVRGPKAIEHGKNIMKEIQSAVKNSSGKNVMVSHASVKEYFFKGEGYELESFPSGVHYYAMGHLHFRIIDDLKDGVIAYPGSLEILTIDEIEEWKRKGKGFYIVDMSADEPVVHQANLDVRPQEIFEISSEDEILGLSKEVESFISQFSSGRRPIVNIAMRGGDSLRRALQPRIERWQKAGAIISISFKRAENSSLEFGPAKSGEWDEMKIVKSVVGEEQIAKLIIDLKNCLSSPEESNCEEIAREITARKDYWEKALKEWPKQKSIAKGGEKRQGLSKFMG